MDRGNEWGRARERERRRDRVGKRMFMWDGCHFWLWRQCNHFQSPLTYSAWERAHRQNHFANLQSNTHFIPCFPFGQSRKLIASVRMEWNKTKWIACTHTHIHKERSKKKLTQEKELRTRSYLDSVYLSEYFLLVKPYSSINSFTRHTIYFSKKKLKNEKYKNWSSNK